MVELALVCKAGGHGLDPQDQTNIHNREITEENLKTLNLPYKSFVRKVFKTLALFMA